LLILSAAAGSTSLGDIAASAHQLPSSVRWLGFVLTFFGFGVKTGLVPVNAWVAPGYAAAPHSLRPVFSGATMNLGIFTFLVIDAPLAIHTTGIGLVAMVVGALTAILGIVYALIERDIAKLLAQSSVENLGIVVAALGAGCAFASLGKPVPAGIALIAGVYHMLNHSAFKTLLFLGAGGIGEATGSRDLDRLGGLLRRLPVFGTLFLAGTMAIAALPPLNGFVSEWLVLESLLRIVEAASVPVRLTFAVSGALLALTAGLALTCFTLVAGTSLLGLARSPEACNASRVPASATVPMACLAFTCLALGVLATAVIPVLGKLVEPLAGVDAGPQLVPSFFTNAAELPSAIATDLAHIGARVGAGWIPLRGLVVLHSGGMATPVIFAMSTALSLAVIALIAGIVWLFARGLRRTRVTRREVWDAGLPKLRPEMTYNATAFSSPVRVLFNTLLRPAIAERVERQGAFAMTQIRETRIVHVIDRLTIQPLITGFNRLARWLAAMHHGRITAYAGYVLVVLGAALLLAVASL
jgi:hydrogenase-4 component B